MGGVSRAGHDVTEELCDEAEALQDLNDRLMGTGDYAPNPKQD